MSIKSAVSDFRNGLSILFNKSKEGEGDRKLAKMCSVVTAQIPLYGKNAVRVQVIKSIESDLKRAAGKGADAMDKLLDNSLNTPEYMTLLRKLDLGETHLRVAAMEAKKVRKAK